MTDQPATAALRRLMGFEAGLTRLLTVIVVFLLCFSTGGAFFGVLSRYFFNTSYDFLEELCLMAVVYASLLYFGPLISRNAHLTMAFLTDRLTPTALRWYDMVLYIAMSLLLLWMLRVAWTWEMSLMKMGLTTMSGQLQAWVPSAALPAGLAIALFYAVLRVIYRLAGVPLITAGADE